MQVLKWDKTVLKKLNRETGSVLDKELSKKVGRIVSEVRERGDAAVRRFTKEFDRVDIPLKKMQVSEAEINRAFEKISVDFVPMLKEVIANVREFYEKDLPKSFSYRRKNGAILGKNYFPLNRVGVYIPGGQAPLVSTVYMTVVPAQVAGVKEIVIATPPNRETGDVDPHILAVANLLGVKEIYRIGGAQAVAALAFGTRTIRKVDKIVGPGNLYVTEAKRQVFGHVDIDMIAGPSEVCIIADEKANCDYVTCDLLAQTEHFGGTAYLITDSPKVVEQMRGRLDSGFIIQVDNLEQACEVSNEIAPEHAQIMVQDPKRLLPKLESAGSVFVGPYSPAVVGDYIAGPSHVLPTAGTAHYFSGLSASDFLKSVQHINYTKEALQQGREAVQKITEIEGLVLHRIAVEARFSANEKKAINTKTISNEKK